MNDTRRAVIKKATSLRVIFIFIKTLTLQVLCEILRTSGKELEKGVLESKLLS